MIIDKIRTILKARDTMKYLKEKLMDALKESKKEHPEFAADFRKDPKGMMKVVLLNMVEDVLDDIGVDAEFSQFCLECDNCGEGK